MKIEQILLQPIGQRFNAGRLTIKTCKKTWQVGDVWYHQVIFMDETGEIPADVQLGKYLPLTRGQEVSLIICAVRETEYLGKPRKMLFVEQYSVVTMTADDWNAQEEEWFTAQQDKIKGMIRHGIICKTLSPLTPDIGVVVLTDDDKKRINDLVDFVMTGK